MDAHARIGSTNDRASELADAGASSWTVVVADEQTRGRGRRGSFWLSPAGTGLLMSVVLGEDVLGEPPPPGALPLVVGLACAEGIEVLLPELDVGLKWPNDLLLGWRKVGGILCESADRGVVVGIGINVTRAPPITRTGSDVDPGRADPDHPGARCDSGARRGEAGAAAPIPPTALEVEAGKALARNELAGEIIRRLRHRLAEGTVSDPAVLSELRRRDVLEGRPVATETEGQGRASGIDASGALLLTRPDGSQLRVVAGGVRLSSVEPDRRTGG